MTRGGAKAIKERDYCLCYRLVAKLFCSLRTLDCDWSVKWWSLVCRLALTSRTHKLDRTCYIDAEFQKRFAQSEVSFVPRSLVSTCPFPYIG